jgi:hypothetical protein
VGEGGRGREGEWEGLSVRVSELASKRGKERGGGEREREREREKQTSG